MTSPAGTGLFGAIAVAREYGHHTVVPTYLTSPRRVRAGLAQLTAVMLGGALLGLVGQTLIIAGVALAARRRIAKGQPRDWFLSPGSGAGHGTGADR